MEMTINTNINTILSTISEEEKNHVKIHTSELIIEVTRRCNFRCDHCLRGDAENLDIDFSTLRKIAKYISPYEVTFTGGEPALNLIAIRKYIEYAEQYGNSPSSFYIVTNGSINQEELAILALQMWTKMDYKDDCGISVSRDDFHDMHLSDEEIEKQQIFKGLSFYSDIKEHDSNFHGKTGYQYLLNEGKAYENQLANSEIPTLETELQLVHSYKDNNNKVYYFESIYVAANGNIIHSCDLSYDHIDGLSPCNIDTLHSYLETNFPLTEENDVSEYKPCEE